MATAYRIDTETNSVRVFSSKTNAERLGNSCPIVTSYESLLENKNLSLANMRDLFNSLTNENVKRFSDRPAAARRLFSALEALEPEVSAAEEKQPEEAAPAKSRKEKRPREDGAEETRGRKKGSGTFAGKTLIGKKDVNPRRPGSHGFKSYEIIREAGAKGISYEDYIARGGRGNDLRWDIAHKWVDVA